MFLFRPTRPDCGLLTAAWEWRRIFIEARWKSMGGLQSRPGPPADRRRPAVGGRGDGSLHRGFVSGCRGIWRALALAVAACLAGPMAASAGPGHSPAIDSEAEIECLALTVYHEARGEPELGQ